LNLLTSPNILVGPFFHELRLRDVFFTDSLVLEKKSASLVAATASFFH